MTAGKAFCPSLYLPGMKMRNEMWNENMKLLGNKYSYRQIERSPVFAHKKRYREPQTDRQTDTKHSVSHTTA